MTKEIAPQKAHARKPPPTSMAIPGMTWSFDLPDRLKIAIADAVTVFSHIDCMLIESVWALEDADLKRKKQIAKEHAAENIKYIRDIVENHMKLDVSAMWDALADLRRERNLIAHGTWSVCFGGATPATDAGGLPMVLWHSKMLEADDSVTAESFDYWRFEKFMKCGRHLLNTFQQFKTMCENAVEEQKRSGPA